MADTFGRYELVKRSGESGLAELFLARQINPGEEPKTCILKRLGPKYYQHKEARSNFLEEGRTTALLRHPSIVVTFDHGEQDGIPYAATEFVDGVPLAQLCQTLAEKGRWIPLRAAVEICSKITDALEYAFNLPDLDGTPLNLIHRSIGPHCILSLRTGEIKIADFGSVSGARIPAYMAPEQTTGMEVTKRTDLFSLGMVLTELISGRRVHKPGQPVVSVIGLTRRVRSLVDLRQDAPEPLKRLAVDLTQVDSTSRPTSAAEVGKRLTMIADSLPPQEALQPFLEQVMTNLFPQATIEQPAKPEAPVDGWQELANDLDEPPPAAPPVAFEELKDSTDSWANQPDEEPSGSAAVYDGWQGVVGDEAKEPQVELVDHSSSVDAMQYFGATGSSMDASGEQPAPQPLTMPRPAAPRPSSVPPAPIKADPLEGLAEEDHAKNFKEFTKKAKKGGQGIGSWPAIYQIGLGLFAVVGLFFIVRGVLGALEIVAFEEMPEPPAPSDQPRDTERKVGGLVEVTSTPPGAEVFVDSLATGEVTPYTIKGLKVRQEVRVYVTKNGYMRAEDVARVPNVGETIRISLNLRKGHVFRVESEPPGAAVSIDGRKLTKSAPFYLDPVRYGTAVEVKASLKGYFPQTKRVEAGPEAPPQISFELEAGREIDLTSDPDGADVFVDGVRQGSTPLFVLVPMKKKFDLRIELAGTKPFRKRLRAKSLKRSQMRVVLKKLSLRQMELNYDERSELETAEKKIRKFSTDMRKRKAVIKRAQAKIDKMGQSSNLSMKDLDAAQEELDSSKEKLEEVQAELEQAKRAKEDLRKVVILRLQSQSEESKEE